MQERFPVYFLLSLVQIKSFNVKSFYLFTKK